MEFEDSYLGATFYIQWFCRSCKPWWMMSLSGPLGKTTKSCFLQGGEETPLLGEISAAAQAATHLSICPTSEIQAGAVQPLCQTGWGQQWSCITHHPRSPDLCQHQILQEAWGKHWLQWVCLQDPSLSVLPTCAHQHSFLLLQNVSGTSTPE